MDLVVKPRSKSSVWQYFGLKADERGRPVNTREVICRLCRKIVLSKGGNTTNLRRHLKRRHRVECLDRQSSTTTGALIESQGVKCNQEEFFEDEPLLQTPSNQSYYIPDAVLPPGEPWLHSGPCRALLSLPACLCLCKEESPGMSGPGSSSDRQMEVMKVYAKCHLQQRLMFGPFVGEECRGEMPADLRCAWAIRDDASFMYIDASDENKANWMRYVTYTGREGEHNLVVFQVYRQIFYKVSRPITEGAELKVWIGKDYASLLGLEMGENVKCDFGDKETILRVLQDIQVVTLPEPSSSSLWSDNSQSQSPTPVISDVTTVTHPDACSDSGMTSAPASASSSLVYVPSPAGQHTDRYDFMPGTEKLLTYQCVSPHNPWYFFGFEPNAAGRPVDRSAAVCKLCGERVCCGGGVKDIQSHLTIKHRIRTPDSNRDRTPGQKSQSLMVSSDQVSTVPLALAAQVNDVIANFLIMDLQPPALVEGEGFKQLIRSMSPSHKTLPSSWQLEDLLKDHHTRGKAGLAQVLRSKRRSWENEAISDYTAPIEFEPRSRGLPSGCCKDLPHFVTLSADVWFHNWQSNTDKYVTLWAHYVDTSFCFQNFALTTKRLTGNGNVGAVEAQVTVMAQEWGISQPNLILLGGEGREKIGSGPIKRESGEAAGTTPHPISTTFLEKEDSDEPQEVDHARSSDGLPSVPCFFSAVRGCIQEVMSHSVISKTLKRLQSMLSTVDLLHAQNKSPYQHQAQNLSQTATRQEQAELQSWAHTPPMWNKLYPLLNTLIKHKSLFCDIVKEEKDEGSWNQDTTCSICPEFTSSGSSCANSTSNASGGLLAPLRSEWKLLEELCLVLKPLDVACRALAKEAFPRLSLIKPILTGLLSRHLVIRPGDSTPVLKEVKKMMRRNLASCYDNPIVNRALCVACSLDPQFHGLGFMGEKEQTATFDWLKKEAVRIVKEDRRRNQVLQNQTLNKRSPSPGSPESKSDLLLRSKRLKESQPVDFRGLDHVEDEDSDLGEGEDTERTCPGSQSGLSDMEFLLGDLFCSTSRSRQSSVEESVDVEVSIYRADKGVPLGVEPLQWWRTKAVQFPLLATVARAYLAAPAVAGNAALDFAHEGPGATGRKRANIPPETLDAILFLHHNNLTGTDFRQTPHGNDDRNSGLEKFP
ncbi:uncharacterized protein LOC142994688 [Genypterus blacodes]|uniref:uncharacterized protein LOC142994688 n=1 Tax=Genypterus blacodes TaxID=154954 RepID=UPI003F772745